MKINCQLPNHTNEEFDFDNIDLEHTSLVDLKTRIYDRTGTPIENQVIEIDNKRLPCRYDKKSLSKLHINESSNLRVVYVLDGGCDCCGCGCDLCGCGGSCRCSIQ
ncbi:hypothetical protein DICPUDRAFT_41498 [Dictyostelium purpureum]|uniref:Ubiquitin-like domain-containing protein n=1 Tax=Dictyostelium purpureum TaxID=5786 RepID=F1A098_DICPU|nr:uncharacterized protein DICPUDRAFT_41498 [Dictyostelium purpureum]EGC30395.1 hypothetical protein DICPUDRAFT_41498 [Dictyostelium purpureum]|eukprot:XP_003293092.1 hypothetical protein DICPUDRAFT_41498 [Dictyostelium purpureum]